MAGWLLGLLKLISMRVETLPVILAQGLLAGRRGHDQFCLAWGEQQLKTCRLLALAGFFWLPCAYVGQLVPLRRQRVMNNGLPGKWQGEPKRPIAADFRLRQGWTHIPYGRCRLCSCKTKMIVDSLLGSNAPLA